MKTQIRIASLSLLTILCLMMLAATSALAGTLLYDNGPPNGTVDAWTINFGYVVSDSFVTPAHSEITDLHFVYWDASSTDLITTVNMQIGTAPFGSDVFSGTLSSVTNTLLGSNGNYNLYQADYVFAAIPYSGPGFVTLSGACTTSGCDTNPIYWDENGGVGCGGTHPPGGGANCPSTAYENLLGTIPSEAFTLTGQGGTTPEPGSIMLFGSGVLGLTGVLRRRLMG